jgi:hypothetical protein
MKSCFNSSYLKGLKLPLSSHFSASSRSFIAPRDVENLFRNCIDTSEFGGSLASGISPSKRRYNHVHSYQQLKVRVKLEIISSISSHLQIIQASL